MSKDSGEGSGWRAGLWCKHCGPTFPLRIEWREEYEAEPLTSFSLAGEQTKISSIVRRWPYAVCDHCNRESRGKTE